MFLRVFDGRQCNLVAHGGQNATREHSVMENLHFQLHLWVKFRRMEGFGNTLIQDKHLAWSETSIVKSGSKTIEEQEGEAHGEKMA